MLSRLKRFLGLEAATTTGVWGESCAATWLTETRGFRVIARNWRSPQDRRDELDLVAMDRAVLVFIEVKTRNAAARVSGFHAVNQRKRDVLRRACDAYLRNLPVSARPATFRFDVVEVGRTGTSATPVVSHFENVPLFRKYYRR